MSLHQTILLPSVTIFTVQMSQKTSLLYQNCFSKLYKRNPKNHILNILVTYGFIRHDAPTISNDGGRDDKPGTGVTGAASWSGSSRRRETRFCLYALSRALRPSLELQSGVA